MKFSTVQKVLPLILVGIFLTSTAIYGQNRDNLPSEFREYTNPEEVVTFDRTTSFARALDVINEFAQKFRKKVVINRTNAEGNIGISVPAMHWMDALKLILRVKDLRLVEKQDFYEIVTPESLQPTTTAQNNQTAAAGAQGQGEGPVATTETYEVRINAIFFEGNRRALQEIGVDWSTISENVPDAILGGGQGGGQGGGGGGQGGQGGQGSGQSIPDSRFDGPFVQVNSKGAESVSQNVFNALINVGEVGNTGIDVQALFSAFEADNLGEVLASPTVKVMDGQEGRIQVGQDFSIKQRDIAGNVVEEFFSVGTILTVTPQVVTQDDTTFIHLDISAERSSAQPDPVSTVINKQQAETQALLLDEEATVIAGLYSTERTEVRRGVPILKDLPPWFFGLRYLFGYSSNDTQMRELVIVLQASLEPTIPQRYGDDFDSKYQVLQDQRNQMQDELEKAQRIMGGETVDEEPIELKDEESDTAPAGQDTTEQEPESEPKMKQEAVDQDTTARQKMDQQEENKQQDAAINDPEVKTKKIELNLGGAESDTTQERQEAAAENQAGQTGDNTTRNQQESSREPTSDVNAAPNYYIVAGSFRVEQNALDFRDKLADQGYEPAIVNMADSDIMLVVYSGFNDLDKAKMRLSEIQQNENSDAWVYRAGS